MRITTKTQAFLQLAAVLALAAIVAIGTDAVKLSANDDSTRIAQVKAPTGKPPKSDPKTKPPIKKPTEEVQKPDVVEDDGPSKPAPPVEYETIKLTDGTEIQIEKWGDTFQSTGVHDAPDLNDPQVEEIIWFKDANLGGGPTSMQVDSKGGKLYWSNAVRTHPTGRIMCSNLVGKQITTLVDNLLDPHDLILDLQHSRMYWLQGTQSKHSLMTADLHGKGVKAVVEGLETPRGLALDSIRGELYYWEHPGHIVRVKIDGTGERQFVGKEQARYLHTSPRAFHWHEKGQALYWMTGSSLQRASRDHPAAELVFETDLPNKHDPFAMDTTRSQVFVIDSVRGQLSRLNMDGSNRELLVTGVARKDLTTGRRGVAGAVAVDELHGMVYFTGGHYEGTAQWTGLFRMKLAQRKLGVTKAPPLITAIAPEMMTHGEKIVIRGEHLSPAKAVVFVDDSTCEHLSAKHQSNDDGSLTVTVPKLGENCHHPFIIVETASGVTMTLRKDLKTPHGPAYNHGPSYIHDRLKSAPLTQIWLPPNTEAGGVESAVAYINRGSTLSPGSHGQALVFAKNGSYNGCVYHRKCVVYHEPFARLGRIKDRDPTTVVHPVPAIRPSFLDHVLTYRN